MIAITEQAVPQYNRLAKGWIIRLAEDGDEVAIRAVAAETWAVTYAQTVRPTNRERVIRQSYAPASLRRAFARNGKNIWFWVAEADRTHEIVGFAEVVLWAGPNPCAELTRIYILPAYQKRGIGAAMLDQTLATLASSELDDELRPPRLILSVEAHNAPAISFYELRGFQLRREFVIPLVGQMLEMKEYALEL